MNLKKSFGCVVGCLLFGWQFLQTIRPVRRKKLYVKIAQDGAVTIGTCQHCVVREQGRPTRSWDANGDAELDFPRDPLVQRLAAFGLHVEIEQEYVCP